MRAGGGRRGEHPRHCHACDAARENPGDRQHHPLTQHHLQDIRSSGANAAIAMILADRPADALRPSPPDAERKTVATG